MQAAATIIAVFMPEVAASLARSSQPSGIRSAEATAPARLSPAESATSDGVPDGILPSISLR